MNNSAYLTIAALKRELEHIEIVYGFKQETKDPTVFMPNDTRWLSQKERLSIITDYIQARLNELEK